MSDPKWREGNPKTAAKQFLIRYYGLEHMQIVLGNIRGQRRELGRGRD